MSSSRSWASGQNVYIEILLEAVITPVNLTGLHLMTQANSYELRMDMEDFEGQKVYALYSSFSVGAESEGYKLTLGDFVRGVAGRVGPSLSLD